MKTFASFCGAVVAGLIMLNSGARAEIYLGPGDSGADGVNENWYYGEYGEAKVFVDTSDPMTKGGYDLVISNSVAGKDNKADWRSHQFAIEDVAKAGRPITFKFSYKLAGEIAKGDNVLVQLRFFAPNEEFISQRVIYTGAASGDSAMPNYKSIIITGIKAPKRATDADVWINAGSFETWKSGAARFANISVTAQSRSWFMDVGIAAAALIGLGVMAMLVIYFMRKRTA